MRWQGWVSLVLLVGGLPCGAPSAELTNGVAAIVNDSVITYADVEKTLGGVLDRLEVRYDGPSNRLRQKRQEILRDGLEELVQRKLILHDFEESERTLPESYVDQIVQERIREQYGDRLTLIKTLKAEGRTFESFRREIREQIIVDLMRRRNINSEILVSPYKIEQYYEENREEFEVEDQVELRMIVLDKGRHGDNTRSLAREILTKLKEGAVFEELAAIYSDGSQSSEGGDWGWVERSILREDLAKLAFSFEPGQLSEVIDREDACYIMEVTDKRSAHVKPLSEVKDEIENTLEARERRRLEQEWMDELKAQSYVRYF